MFLTLIKKLLRLALLAAVIIPSQLLAPPEQHGAKRSLDPGAGFARRQEQRVQERKKRRDAILKEKRDAHGTMSRREWIEQTGWVETRCAGLSDIVTAVKSIKGSSDLQELLAQSEEMLEFIAETSRILNQYHFLGGVTQEEYAQVKTLIQQAKEGVAALSIASIGDLFMSAGNSILNGEIPQNTVKGPYEHN